MRQLRILDREPSQVKEGWQQEQGWHGCAGGNFVFLGARRRALPRSNYSTRIVRPAAGGWYPEGKGPQSRAAAPVLADLSEAWPGAAKSPWPSAVPGEPYEPPTPRASPTGR